MGNERLRKQMAIFAIVAFSLGILTIYLQYLLPDKAGRGLGSNWKKEYYDDGKIRAEGELQKGYLKNGEWTYYREDGSILLKETYKDGILQSTSESK
ncbi:MAG: hypothetical protein SFW35_11695 [Chitinophagales bacterium]|nr:hypothetical protein [Chitinophagales bacterium]